MEFLTYYFHIKTKIMVDFQIHISVSLKAQRQISKNRYFEKYRSCDKACHVSGYREDPDGVDWKNWKLMTKRV